MHRLRRLVRRAPIAVAVLVVPAVLITAACSGGTVASSSPTASPDGGTAPAVPKVTVAGDSISIGLGAAIRQADPAADVKVIGQEGTGLARPDTFDWPGRLRQLAHDFPPAVLVLSLSSNDAQDLRDASGTVVAPVADPAAWDAEYERRLASAFDAFAGTATTVVWVGHVRTADPKVGGTNRHIQQLATAVAATRPFVVVDDLAVLLGTGDQPATRCLVADGLHLTVACLDEAAAKLVPSLPD
jgi:hypothetical protein